MTRQHRIHPQEVPQVKAALRYIIELSRTREVYLICWEKELPCHRFILLEMAKELAEGVKVRLQGGI